MKEVNALMLEFMFSGILFLIGITLFLLSVSTFIKSF